jgi:integrase
LPLTDIQVRNAKPVADGKQRKLSDAGGLTLLVRPTGSKLWQFRYRFDGKEKTLSIGAYPSVSLSNARTARDDAKKILSAGRDPMVAKQVEKAATITAAGTTFESIAREWYEHNRTRWRGTHVNDVIQSLEKDAFPTIGNLPISEITPQICLTVIKGIEARGAYETAHRVFQRMSATFQYGIAAQACATDPALMIKTLLKPKPTVVPQPAITNLSDLRAMMRTIESVPAHPVTKLAMRFLALTFVRPDTLHTTPWAEIEKIGSDGVWKIPNARMKMDRDFWITLPRQACDVIEALRPLTGASPFLFPNDRWAHKPMSENAILFLLKRAGYGGIHCGHGFRASFNTIMSERHQGDKSVEALLDMMLAHASKKGPYNRADQLDRRAELGQEWADMVLEGFPPAVSLIAGPRR